MQLSLAIWSAVYSIKPRNISPALERTVRHRVSQSIRASCQSLGAGGSHSVVYLCLNIILQVFISTEYSCLLFPGQ